MPNTSEVKERLVAMIHNVRGRVRRHVPFGFRWPIGLVLIGGGFLGFLPILGFWMIPLGIAVAALDVVPAWRFLIGRKKDKHND